MYKLYRNNRLVKKSPFVSYEQARNFARKQIRKSGFWTLFTNANNPPMGEYGYTVKRIVASPMGPAT